MSEQRADGWGRAGPWSATTDLDDSFRTLWDHLVVRDPAGPSDAIFCFGSRDRSVPARAARLFAEGIAPIVMVSGGGLIDGSRSEAEVFADDLVARGVPIERIVTEHASMNTGENVVLGMAGLSVHIDLHRITAVSWPLCARRCRATLARHHPDVAVLSAPALDHPDEVWPVTSRATRAALGEWDPLGAYAERGFIVAQPRPPEVRDAVSRLRRSLGIRAPEPTAVVEGLRPEPATS